VKSAILLAGLQAHGTTIVHEAASDPRLHRAACCMPSAGRWSFPRAVRALTGGHRLRATQVSVPADFSSAAFFLVAATIVPGSDVVLRRVA
jgi:3-phosphoshikimate 1-carboxyvinyltransferase